MMNNTLLENNMDIRRLATQFTMFKIGKLLSGKINTYFTAGSFRVNIVTDCVDLWKSSGSFIIISWFDYQFLTSFYVSANVDIRRYVV